jgi:hypothetical protein
MNEFLTQILPIGVLLTFISSMVGLFLNYKAIKKSKYIEFVTAEKIKWIDTIKNESSVVISKIQLSLIEFENINRELRIQNNQEIDISEETELQRIYVHSQTTDVFPADNQSMTQLEVVKSLQLLSFRLHLERNKPILSSLDYFIEFYTLQFHSEGEIKKASNKLDSFKTQLHEFLEIEWKRILKEI